MGTDASGSGSTSNASSIGGPFSVTDNSKGDIFTILSQPNSAGSVASQQPGNLWPVYIAGLILVGLFWAYAIWKRK